MKFHYRLFTVFGSIACLSCQLFASGLIVRLSNSSDLQSVLADYPSITSFDKAGKSPFARFVVDDANVDQTIQDFQIDYRVRWVVVDGDIKGRNSGHGSSVAAIIDRSVVSPANPAIFRQINLTVQDHRPTSVKVGIVDTGVSPLQPDLRAKIVASASFVPGSPTIDDLPTGLDTNQNGVLDEGAGHGTIIAGLIAQIGPNIPLIVAKSADSDGVATPWSVIQGVEFCVENGAKIINVSLGSQTILPGFAGFLDWVEQNGSLIVAPIGNNRTFGSLYPAAYGKVVCVTGLDSNNNKADFSNWDTIARVAAPANGLVGPWFNGEQANWSGTSLAAPLVTGSLAVALGSHSSRSPEFLRFALTVSGKNIDLLNPLFHGKLGKLLDFTNLSFFLRGD